MLQKQTRKLAQVPMNIHEMAHFRTSENQTNNLTKRGGCKVPDVSVAGTETFEEYKNNEFLTFKTFSLNMKKNMPVGQEKWSDQEF